MDIKHKLLILAQDNLGIYPQGSTDVNGVYTKRTEWQDGWNAAVLKLSKNKMILNKWFSELPGDVRDTVENLIIEGALTVHIGNGVTLEAGCSDIFAWACADSEKIKLDDVKDFAEACNKDWGAVIWIAKRRKLRPQKPVEEMMRCSGAWDAELEEFESWD